MQTEPLEQVTPLDKPIASADAPMPVRAVGQKSARLDCAETVSLSDGSSSDEDYSRSEPAHSAKRRLEFGGPEFPAPAPVGEPAAQRPLAGFAA